MQLNIRAGDVPPTIRKVAEEVAGVFYDQNRTERFRQYAGTQRDFVRQAWTKHIPIAIELLGQLLSEPGTSAEDKEAIYDALVEFNTKMVRGKPNFSLKSLQ